MLVSAAVSPLGRGLSGGGANCRPDPAPGPSVPSSPWAAAPQRPPNSGQTELLRCSNLRPSTAAPAGGGTPLTRNPEKGRLPEPQNCAACARLPLRKPAQQRAGVPAVRRGSGGCASRARPLGRCEAAPSREERSRPRAGTGTGPPARASSSRRTRVPPSLKVQRAEERHVSRLRQCGLGQIFMEH